jgi:hypothetical protein
LAAHAILCRGQAQAFHFHCDWSGLDRAFDLCEGEIAMNTIINLAALATATLLAVAAAVGLDWLLLRAAFHFVRPAAAARQMASGTGLAPGTRNVARAFASHR